MGGHTLPAIFIGFDPREAAAFAVARHSIESRLSYPIGVYPLILSELQEIGLYKRPTESRKNEHGGDQLYDVISGKPMATEFALTRFLLPHLNPGTWSLFMDCDMLVRADLVELFKLLDDSKAVMCVKHDHRPTETVKMDKQVQTSYPRKNWSSVMAINPAHPANEKLTLDLINSARGLELHQFCWIENEDDIGELGVEWNWLAGHSDPSIEPKIVHHTDGSPCMAGFENVPYADEWRAELRSWAGSALAPHRRETWAAEDRAAEIA